MPFAISLVFVMYSYSGWNAATYIIDEIQEPNRSLPRALFLGTLIVIGLYVSLNAVFLAVTPIQELAGQLDVAMIAGTHLFGDVGGRIVGMLICVGLVSSISAMMWIGPRVTMTMGEDMPLLRVFSRRSQRGQPATAIIFQLVVSSLLLLSQSFEAVLDFIQFSLTFCSFFTVLGRHQDADHASGHAAPLPGLGLSGDAAHLPQRDAVDDVLPRRQPAGAVPRGLRHDALRRRDLLPVPSAVEGNDGGNPSSHRLNRPAIEG